MSDFTVIRLREVNDNLIEQINQQFDIGTTWDMDEGAKFLADDNILLVAKSEDNIVGFLTGYRLQRIDKRKAEVLLYEIGVDEKFRRKGVGKALVEELKIWAKSVGADEVWVITNKSNAEAVALYKSAGGITEASDEQMYVFKI